MWQTDIDGDRYRYKTTTRKIQRDRKRPKFQSILPVNPGLHDTGGAGAAGAAGILPVPVPVPLPVPVPAPAAG